MVSQFLFSICLRELLSLSFRNNPRDGSDVEVIQTLDPEVAGLRAHPLVDAVDVVSACINESSWTVLFWFLGVFRCLGADLA